MDMIEFFKLYYEHLPAWWPQIVPAIGNTIGLTAGAYMLAVVLGLILAVGKTSKIGPFRWFCTGYIEVVRGIPSLAILFLLYFGLVPLGIVLDAFTAGFIGLGLSGSAYIAEVFRAGLEAVHKGQREAALAVGMTPFASFRYITLPQAIRVVLPPLLNMLIMLLKDSSICSLISTPELMLRAKDLASEYFLPMHVYLLIGVLYFALAFPLSLLAKMVQKRMSSSRRVTE
ncbi:MAG: amino acid ABC transporter permease [Desulfobacterales bacterium]|nr:amino acid ABC transporter permease [Desulfobacterales bacterium]